MSDISYIDVAPLIPSSYIAEMPRSFGEAINFLLAERKWEIKELAARTKVDRVSISRHVNNRVYPHLSTRKLYADAFGVSLEQLHSMYDLPPEESPSPSPKLSVAELSKMITEATRSHVQTLPADQVLKRAAWSEPKPKGKGKK